MSNQSHNGLTPAILVIFGITGDLSQRYLMPALYNLTKNGQLHKNTQIVGITRRDTTTDELYRKIEGDADVLAEMRQRTCMFKMDLDDPKGYSELLQKLNSIEEEQGMCLNRLYYLSIPPKAYPPVIQLMGQQGLNKSCQHNRADTRLMVEKPFGSDLKSAQNLLTETAEHFTEEQTFRIDHYMAKQAVQDILTSRFNGQEREATWDKDHIDSIEIFAKEKIGIEGRAVFYEPLGAMRDFIQSHLFQVLGVTTMEMPAKLDSDGIHEQKEAVLAQVEPVPAHKVRERVLRGQYKGYRQEVGNPESTTETYVSLTVYIDNARWQGVPITLLTGKALDDRKAAVVAKFKDGSEFEFRIQPEINPTANSSSNAYEKVFSDAINGDHSLFASSPEIIASWRVLQPVIDAWSQSSDDLAVYEQGSAGPKQTAS
jgi:glucose-6-phosphate 1-dehydrogenase